MKTKEIDYKQYEMFHKKYEEIKLKKIKKKILITFTLILLGMVSYYDIRFGVMCIVILLTAAYINRYGW